MQQEGGGVDEAVVMQCSFKQLFINKGFLKLVTLPETNIFAPENLPGPKRKLVFQPSMASGAMWPTEPQPWPVTGGNSKQETATAMPPKACKDTTVPQIQPCGKYGDP